MFPKTMVLTPISVIIFTRRPFPHPTFTGARGAHKRHHGNNYSYQRVQNSYQLYQNLDSTLFFYYFYMSSLPTLSNTIAKGSSFLIRSPFAVTKLQKNCLDISSTGRFPFPKSMDTNIHILYHPYGEGHSTWI